MIKNVANAILAAARQLIRDWRLPIVFLSTYLALLLALFFFITTRDINVWQLLLTFTLAVIAPVLFFLLQTMGVSYAGDCGNPALLFRYSLRNFWKLVLISVPLVLLGWLIIYLLGKLQAHLPDAATAATHSAADALPLAQNTKPVSHWGSVLLAALRFLMLYIALPVAAIHLWIMVAHAGLIKTIKGLLGTLGRAFRPGRLLIYMLGFGLFAGIPYLLLFMRTPVRNEWLELSLLAARLIIALIFVLFGWTLTLGALTKINAQGTKATAPEPPPAPQNNDAI